MIYLTALFVHPPTPSYVVEAVAFRASHFVGDGCCVVVAILFPFASFAGMFWWEVVPTRKTVGVTSGMGSFRALALGQIVIAPFRAVVVPPVTPWWAGGWACAAMTAWRIVVIWLMLSGAVGGVMTEGGPWAP
jgi:hypothetical protein